VTGGLTDLTEQTVSFVSCQTESNDQREGRLMPSTNLHVPEDAIRAIDRALLAGWNAVAHERGRTAFTPAGIDVIAEDEPIFAYAAYAIGEADSPDKFGISNVPGDWWLLVACLVWESARSMWAGRMIEVQAGAFRQAPLASPPPNVLSALYQAGERYREKREQMGLPIGTSLHELTGP